MAKAYPRAAMDALLFARAVLYCRVTEKGTLTDCTTPAEEPAGAGAAAIELSRLFRMQPRARDGSAVAGRSIRIPVRFTLPVDMAAAPSTVRNEAFVGVTVELNCRYRDVRLDDCHDAQARTYSEAAFQAAVEFAQGTTLPSTPRPAGRILLPVKFIGDGPPIVTPTTVTPPMWLRRPTSSDVAQVIPEKTAREGVSGEAIISCVVAKDGRLADCVVVSETPVDAGFGAAALKLAGRFQMQPTTAQSQSVEGGTVRIPIRFVAPN
ncbi:TonB family protein [Phenylobacterium sp.]|uniref:TonB family protein n=1 Tax=Phenylobacterium sp. TaxID=1871053 RepID=UPI0025F859D9|nr:TonB family protein [Phenylobacterium sp.]